MNRGTSRISASACALLLLPTASIFAVLLVSGAPFCCDANFYLKAIAGHRSEGLFYEHALVGYRPYLFPYLFSLIPLDLATVVAGDVTVYSLVSSASFLAVELAVLMWLRGSDRFWVFYAALFVNPLLLVYVVYPLQEGFLVLVFAALVPWLLASDSRGERLRYPVVLGLFFGAMYMARAWHLVLALPAAVLLAAHLRAVSGVRERAGALAAFAGVVVALVAPQSAITLRHLDTIAPYPSSVALSDQLRWGEAYAKYATNVAPRLNFGFEMPHWNPLNCETRMPTSSKVQRLFRCALETNSRRRGLGAKAFTVLIHVFNALDYHVLRPYIAKANVPLFSMGQLLSMTVVFFGAYGACRKLALREALAPDWFLMTTTGATLAVVAVTAVETRFGVLATASLSVLAFDLLLRARMTSREWLPLGFGLAAFLAVSSLLSVYVFALSGGAALE